MLLQIFTKQSNRNEGRCKNIGRTGLWKWLDTVFQGQYLPSLSINYVATNNHLEKLPPQLYYVSVKSKLQHPPPPLPGIPWAFDTFVVPGRREFDYQSLPGSGEFDPHAKGVGNLNRSLDFMWNVWALCTWRAIMAGTRCATNADCRLTDRQVNEVKIVVKFSNRFRIPKLDFPKTQSLVIGNLLKLSQQCLRRLPASMQVCSLRLSHTACPHVCLLIRCRYDARQWNSHKWHVWNVMISERFVCCMTNEEKLSLQCPCSSDFRRFAREFCSY